MGKGISLAFAFAGYDVALIDSEQRDEQAFSDLRDSIFSELRAELGLLEEIAVLSAPQVQAVISRVGVYDYDSAGRFISEADFVFEAVLEVMEVKQAVYGWLKGFLSADTIVSSTTSTMSANELANFLEDGSSFVNAHWLNPAYLIPLVEVSPAEITAPHLLEKMVKLLEDIGKVTVICKASPGFIIGRIQSVALNEAARIVEDGVASAEDVDKAIKAGFGIRYATQGLLEFIDFGGGDILYHATSYLGSKLGESRFSVPDIVKENMANGHNGLRDGEGFYNWRDMDVEDYRKNKMDEFVKLLQHRNLMPHIKTAD